MLAAITFNVATSLEPCATHGQPYLGVKSAQELRRMNKSQAFHRETIPKHVFGSWSSWQVCQLEQLGAAKRGVLHQQKGRMKLHSINRELHTHSRGSQIHIFTSSITLIHTFRFTTKREESLELSWEFLVAII
ncbi:unnamed protein product [Prunus armeniaca]